MENSRTQPPPLLRRSELTCPAHNAHMIEKASRSDADEVILDLEDACAPSQKVGARRTVVEALQHLNFGNKIRAVRCNGTRSPLFYRDLVDIFEPAGQFVDSLVLPKVDGPEDVQLADRLLSQIEAASGLPAGRIRLEALIETAQGLLSAEAIARASPRMASLIFGIADFAGSIGARDFAGDSGERFHHAKAHILVAARAAGLDAIDHVTVQFRDLERCRKDAQGALSMGYDGKWAIHPSQVAIINGVFTPAPEQVARARRILEAYAAAGQQGLGAIEIESEMIDAASLRVERRLIAAAERAGKDHG